MDENIVYRKVEPKELEPYHKLRLECLKEYPQFFGTLYEEEMKSSGFKFDKIITQQSPTDFLMGAFSQGMLIGICGFIQEKRGKTKHIGEISGMYVMSQFSNQKIGGDLLDTTIQTAFGNMFLEQIILAVTDKNVKAKNLYLKRGFVEYGRLNQYFKYKVEYETLVLMTLTKEIANTKQR